MGTIKISNEPVLAAPSTTRIHRQQPSPQGEWEAFELSSADPLIYEVATFSER
ncbi:hypothetical protein [Streptacidiphilus melanogenes]|uniref:hypothetical protein n=1 Tax=Streptacidiphilus melanogenes TaxID=411235 RepID=UPI001F1D3AE8|nr:hypothetical protein [Streptacidiphilus melanogenes]